MPCSEMVTRRIALNWFGKLKNGILEHQDAPRPGRQSEVSDDQLQALFQKEGDLGEKMNCNHRTVDRNLRYIILTMYIRILKKHGSTLSVNISPNTEPQATTIAVFYKYLSATIENTFSSLV